MTRTEAIHALALALGAIIALLLLIAQAILTDEANAYQSVLDADGRTIVMPDYVGRSLDKVIVTRPGGRQETIQMAPGTGTSYVYPTDPDVDCDDCDEDDDED